MTREFQDANEVMPEPLQSESPAGTGLSACPFCGWKQVEFVFKRAGKRFGRCRGCSAYLWLEPEIPKCDPYADGEFARCAHQYIGDSPAWGTLNQIRSSLIDGTLLEIGPGTGNFLAAARDAGYQVAGVELSPSHRRYIRGKWGIDTSDVPIETVNGEALFDNVVSINCIEHVCTPEEHFRAVHRVLKPGGRFVVITDSSVSLTARLTGRWWTMLKVPDHVNLVSPRSLRLLGERTGLRLMRQWTGESYLETPVAVAASIRDWWRERRNSPSAVCGGSCPGREQTRKRARYWMTRSVFAPIGFCISFFGLGASVRTVFEKPGGQWK